MSLRQQKTITAMKTTKKIAIRYGIVNAVLNARR